MGSTPPEVWGDGEQTRDFVYVEDFVKCILASAETDYTGIVNVGTGKSVSFKELLQIIKETLETDIDPIFIPKEKNYVEHLKADTTLMEKVLGVKPLSPQEGIKKFIKYLKDQK